MTSLKKDKILIIGAGNMGISFIKALINNNIASKNIFVLEKNSSRQLSKLKKDKKINVVSNISFYKENQKPDIVLLAVKPNQLESLFDNKLKSFLNSSIIISIIAGKKLSILKKITGNKEKTVRAMTNTPISVGMGVSVVFFDKKTNSSLKNKSKSFLKLVGLVNEVKKESLIDSFTAIFGSGPAYIYYFIEVLTKIAKKNGHENADFMTIQLFLGSLLLMLNERESPQSLRKRVTSKGGTTHAAIQQLEKYHQFEKLMNKAISDATIRSKELN